MVHMSFYGRSSTFHKKSKIWVHPIIFQSYSNHLIWLPVSFPTKNSIWDGTPSGLPLPRSVARAVPPPHGPTAWPPIAVRPLEWPLSPGRGCESKIPKNGGLNGKIREKYRTIHLKWRIMEVYSWENHRTDCWSFWQAMFDDQKVNHDATWWFIPVFSSGP